MRETGRVGELGTGQGDLRLGGSRPAVCRRLRQGGDPYLFRAGRRVCVRLALVFLAAFQASVRSRM